MKRLILNIVALCSASLLWGQEYDVIIDLQPQANAVAVRAINISNVQQEVTLTMKVKNYRGYSRPITKLVKAKDTLEMVRLTPLPNKRSEMSYTYQYLPKPTNEEIAAQDKLLEQKKLEVLGDIDEGIVLFYKDGCPRCSFATTYMLDNDIDFKMLDVTDDEEKNRAMWKLINAEKPELREVIFPVFLIDGELSYSIEDLKGFTSELDIFRIR